MTSTTKGKAARKARTVAARTVASEYGSRQHATETTPAHYAVMVRRDTPAGVIWQQCTPRVNGDRVEMMSRTGVVMRLAMSDRVTVSDEVRDGDVAVSWHRLRPVHAHGETYGATMCTEPHLRGYGADGTSYCYARKARTGASTRKAGLTAEAAALAAAEAAAEARRDAARKAAATRKARKAADRKATAPAATVRADEAAGVLAALADEAVSA